jgi:hypothetical protein
VIPAPDHIEHVHARRASVHDLDSLGKVEVLHLRFDHPHADPFIGQQNVSDAKNQNIHKNITVSKQIARCGGR